MHRFLRRFLAASLALACLGALAQEFPSKTIRIIVPTFTGTASDVTGRFIADQMAKELKVGVVIDNKSGANGILAVSQFLAAPPDGYTLLLSASGLYANAALYKNLAYDPVKDFRIVAGINEVFFVLVASPTLPVDSVKELVEYAKERPEDVTYASASVGSSTHLGPELFASRAGIKLRHIPYKGGAQAITDTAGGQVNIAMTAVPTAASVVVAGKLKALAVTGSKRPILMPNLPTLAESGIAGAEITSKQGIVAPAGIPEAAAAKLTATITRIVNTPEYAKFLESQGVEKETLPTDVYAKSGPDELKRWTEMVKISDA